MENLENVITKNNKVEDTKYYNIYGERVLDLGKDIISSILNFYNLQDSQKKTIKAITNLPQVSINNVKYYVLTHNSLKILIKSSVLNNEDEKEIISAEEIFGHSYFKKDLVQKNTIDNTLLNNFIFICNTNNLIDFYQLEIPETGCILVFNNKKNSGVNQNRTDLMSISDIAKLCYKQDCCFKFSQFFSKSVVNYFLKKQDDLYKSLYNEIFNLVESSSFALTQQSIKKFKLIASKIVNKRFNTEQKLFLIALYYGYIENKISSKKTLANDFIKLLKHLKINVANKDDKKIVNIQEDFIIGNYLPSQNDIESITNGINKYNKNNYVTFKKVLLKSNK